jgi:hypothetical protein
MRRNGWFRDSYRHSLAAQGIATKPLVDVRPVIQHDPVKRLKELEREARILRRKGVKIRKEVSEIVAPVSNQSTGFTQLQLEAGIKHEMNVRGVDRQTATSIAVGNLIKNPRYYDARPSMAEKFDRKKYIEEQINELEAEEEEEKDKKDMAGNRQSMAYTPTYVIGDLPLIATDAVGTAGATAVALAPLAVTAGVLYWGTKKVKKDYDKTKKELKKK